MYQCERCSYHDEPQHFHLDGADEATCPECNSRNIIHDHDESPVNTQ